MKRFSFKNGRVGRQRKHAEKRVFLHALLGITLLNVYNEKIEKRHPMLTIAVSSRSLFHLEEDNQLFEKEGQEAFDEKMVKNENEPLEPGIAFSFVKKFLALQAAGFSSKDALVRVIILSRNSPEAGVRVMKSIQHYGLNIESAAFTAGGNRFRYAQAMNVDLFLSANASDAKDALKNGIAAATIVPRAHVDREDRHNDNHVRIALDGDSVLFSDEADRMYRDQGLIKFIESELINASVPLGEGPFKKLLAKFCELQTALTQSKNKEKLKIALVTARGVQSHERAITTLRSWGLSVDEMIFAGGLAKGPLVRAYGADFFFDDTSHHIESATAHDVAAGHVPFGSGGIAGTQEHKALPAPACQIENEIVG